jgi:long-chain acyl-CoA synthetase
MIVLAGGENIRPEIVEDAFTCGDHIREVGVLEHDDRLVALNRARTRSHPVACG